MILEKFDSKMHFVLIPEVLVASFLSKGTKRVICKLNDEGVKVKVRRSDETSFDVYHNGHFVTTDAQWEQAFELVQVLLDTK